MLTVMMTETSGWSANTITDTRALKHIFNVKVIDIQQRMPGTRYRVGSADHTFLTLIPDEER